MLRCDSERPSSRSLPSVLVMSGSCFTETRSWLGLVLRNQDPDITFSLFFLLLFFFFPFLLCLLAEADAPLLSHSVGRAPRAASSAATGSPPDPWQPRPFLLCNSVCRGVGGVVPRRVSPRLGRAASYSLHARGGGAGGGVCGAGLHVACRDPRGRARARRLCRARRRRSDPPGDAR